LSRCGIHIRGRRSRRLKINYRTTEKIQNWAVAILKGLEVDDMDEGVDTLKGYRSLRTGADPEVVHWDSPEEEGQYIVERIRTWLGQPRKPEDICIAVRSH